ncbi:hypothetical protein [Enterobacter roggenkampii]|uniref:hypothetical protein n=1 Tax=Enterobacter roggenkampii TaxID=1812935 RepID=UPI000B2F52B5|nr:hypothetical protein [Enterobacter roggenkampii]MBW9467987.1 hypothetical protein [Enterobacter roggenkampii]MCL5502037.1 hypothetical protein [Escherichia coli]HAT7705152.1 hypothetical protein [Enterobacter roggenkampii]
MDCYDYVSEKDIRKCRFYVRYMENRERSRIRVSTNFDWENNSGNVWETNTWINNELDSYFRRRDVKYINDFVDEMEALCKDEILPLEEFNWFRHDKRICLWLWRESSAYRGWRDHAFPDHRGRFEALVEYFDVKGLGGNKKRELLDDYKDDWQRKGNTEDPFSKENSETINYLWNYTVKLHGNINRYFSPISDDDRKICLTGFYDCILDTPEKKELFLRKMKSALSSHKHREKAGKGNINKKFLLSLENDKKLNDMIAISGMKRDDFMNRLIASEYERRAAEFN